MKNTKLLTIGFILFGISFSSFSQNIKDTVNSTYRRSSLYTILIESDVYDKQEYVNDAYYKMPFPDKYNDHIAGAQSMIPKAYSLTSSECSSFGLDAANAGKVNEKTMVYILNKYFEQNKTANAVVAKWFNRKEDGSFDMSLISERGFYNATKMEAQIAAGTVRGIAALADAGEELIANTFIVASQLNFISNEVSALAAKEIAISAANRLPYPIAKEAAIATANAVYEQARKGYSVWTTSYLFKLKWDEETAAIFYSQYWMDSTNATEAKKQAFDSTNIFKLEFIGAEKAKSLVVFGGDRSESEIIEVATIRNVNNVYTSLQKAYDVFKTKTPLYSGKPLRARIGMKEGVSKGDKFEVLEQVINPKTGKTEYQKVGIIKAKKPIWDNRYVITEEKKQEEKSEESNNAGMINDNEFTYFSGSGKYYAGMLIRQIK